MGIDIYARWKGQTAQEEQEQLTGFSVIHGHVGYLREAYHGEPYATRYLVKEAFESPTGKARIPARVLKERLPHALVLAEQRQREVYGETDPKEIQKVLQSFCDFVALCERKEQETGKPVTIVADY
jgi:hypothetical protein